MRLVQRGSVAKLIYGRNGPAGVTVVLCVGLIKQHIPIAKLVAIEEYTLLGKQTNYHDD